jgi:hypothetical protein
MGGTPRTREHRCRVSCAAYGESSSHGSTASNILYVRSHRLAGNEQQDLFAKAIDEAEAELKCLIRLCSRRSSAFPSPYPHPRSSPRPGRRRPSVRRALPVARRGRASAAGAGACAVVVWAPVALPGPRGLSCGRASRRPRRSAGPSCRVVATSSTVGGHRCLGGAAGSPRNPRARG